MPYVDQDPDDKTPGIRKIYNPDEEERELIKHVYDRKKEMEDSEDRQRAMTQAEKGVKAWEGWRQEKNNSEWQSNHIVPITFSVIETAHSEVVDLQLRPQVGASGDEDKPKAKVMKHAFDHTCEIGDFDVELADIWQDTLIKGTAIAKEYYWTDKRVVRHTNFDKAPKEKYKTSEIVDFDDVYMENIRLEDFYVDEKARGFRGPHGARDCIERMIMHVKDAQDFFNGSIWDPLKNMQYVEGGVRDTGYWEWYHPPEATIKKDEVEVLWYWAVKPYDCMRIVINDVLIKDGPNPYKHKRLPYARNVDVKRTHKFYGKGEPEILESIQDEANTHRRMTIDRAHLDIDKMFIVSTRTALTDEDLIARPHGMIPSDDPNMARPVEYGDTPNSVEKSYEHLEDDSTISTGINPRAQSLPTAGSATEAAILKESTLKRIRKKIWNMKREFLPQIARMRGANIVQFYSQPRLEEMVGDKATQDYQAEVSKLQEQGLLLQQNGKTYKKNYRQISVQDKQLSVDAAGQLNESSASGTTFFTMKPQFFVPVERGGFTFTYDQTEDLVISKPLQQTQDKELFDRLVPFAVPGGPVDPAKLVKMLVESSDKNPDDLAPDQPNQQESDQRLQMLIQLATMENDQMMKGVAVPATPNASVAHTQVHIAKMQSPEFKDPKIGQDIVSNFTHHIMGELIAQQSRQMGATGGPPGSAAPAPPGAPTPGGPTPPPASPPSGTPPQGGPRSGMMGRPGGTPPPPTTQMGSILPGFQTGGQRNGV